MLVEITMKPGYRCVFGDETPKAWCINGFPEGKECKRALYEDGEAGCIHLKNVRRTIVLNAVDISMEYDLDQYSGELKEESLNSVYLKLADGTSKSYFLSDIQSIYVDGNEVY